MASIRFETNAPIPEDRAKILTQNMTKAVARVSGEPESEIRVELAGNRRMRMSDSDEPIAHVEIRNAELPKDKAAELTKAICPVLEEAMGIQNNNIYIAVVTRRNSMWRVNGDMQQQ